jgi:thiol-disulfide isomerase/thioredoxin
MIMRRWLPILAGLALVAVLVVGILQAGGPAEEKGPKFDLEQALSELRTAPAPLGGLHAQANDLVDGDVRERVKELRGHPVVVNKWASWCGPCRAEFPVFQQVSTELGKEVAFLGLNGKDNRGDAQEFLAKFPLPFPSYVDPEEKVAREIGLGVNYPMTSFYDASGKRTFVHQGQYHSAADLRADIEQYAR